MESGTQPEHNQSQDDGTNRSQCIPRTSSETKPAAYFPGGIPRNRQALAAAEMNLEPAILPHLEFEFRGQVENTAAVGAEELIRIQTLLQVIEGFVGPVALAITAVDIHYPMLGDDVADVLHVQQYDALQKSNRELAHVP